jgi:hypothetical protein
MQDAKSAAKLNTEEYLKEHKTAIIIKSEEEGHEK